MDAVINFHVVFEGGDAAKSHVYYCCYCNDIDNSSVENKR